MRTRWNDANIVTEFLEATNNVCGLICSDAAGNPDDNL